MVHLVGIHCISGLNLHLAYDIFGMEWIGFYICICTAFSPHYAMNSFVMLTLREHNARVQALSREAIR